MPFPVQANWITETEDKLGVRFPASFVVAMSKMNGGWVDTAVDRFDLFPFFDGSDKKRLKRTCGSIDRETLAARRNLYGFPNDAVVIGASGCGDLLILIPMQEDVRSLRHSVYWRDHETGVIQQLTHDFAELAKS